MTIHVEFQGMLDLLEPTRSPVLTHGYVLLPNLTDPAEARKALGIQDSSWLRVHEPKLIVDLDSLDGDPPKDLFQEDPCHKGLHFTSLAGKHLDVGRNIGTPVFADRTPLQPDPACAGSLWWLTAVDRLLATHEKGAVDAKLRSDLLDPQYKPGGAYPPMTARVQVHSGRLEVQDFFMKGGKKVVTGFHHCKVAPAAPARTIAATFSSSSPPPVLELRNLDGSGSTVQLKLKSGAARVRVHHHPGQCGNLPGKNDFVAHYLLRDWKAVGKEHPFPVAGGHGPFGDPQCSPGDNPWP